MKKVVTFGELLLSLSAKGNSRLVQAEEFTARYTGAEANVAVSLTQFGVETFMVSKVPDHEIGQACVNGLRRFGVNTDHIVRGGQRLGLLYMEVGASQRPTKVIYDRCSSSFRCIRLDDFSWSVILKDKNWFHFSGTAPAFGHEVAEVLAAGLTMAKQLGLTTSCDCNYRSKLWSKANAGRVLTPLLRWIDVLICGIDDLETIFGIRQEQGGLSEAARDEHTAELMRKRFDLDSIAITFRHGISASVNQYSAMLCRCDGIHRSRQYDIQIVDRVGTGDAFAAGLIFGLISGFSSQRTIDFAAAAACLKHSIPGDFNLVSCEEVEQLLTDEHSGRVRR